MRISRNAAAIAVGLFVVPVLSFAAAVAPGAPPLADVKPVTDEYFGVKVTDNYRYFENLKDPMVQAWAKAQADYASKVLASIPGRDALLARIVELDGSVPARLSEVQVRPGNVFFYQKRMAADNQFKLYLKDGSAKEHLLVDPDALARKTGTPEAINYFEASPDGRYLAYGISEGGSEKASLHVLDVRNGRQLGAAIARAEFGGISWTDDSRGFFYSQLKQLKAGDPAVEKYRDSSDLFHRVVSSGPDTLVWNAAHQHGAALTDDDNPFVTTATGSGAVIAVVQNGVQNETALYVGQVRDAISGRVQWHKAADVADAVTSFAVHGNDLYLLSHDKASRFKVLRTDLRQPDFTNAEVVMAASDDVISAISPAKDGLYIQTRHATLSRLYRLAYEHRASPQLISLPFDGSIEALSTDSGVNGAIIDMGGWTRDDLIYAVAADGSSSDTKLKALGPYGKPDSITAREVFVKSHDGVEVPLSIIYPSNIALDGHNPVRLSGYGSYGITDDPRFQPRNLAWFDHGGVMAVCHVRGGGTFGEDWHLAGKISTKPNTWKDAIACAQYLIDNGYGSAKTMSINGGSAGGILVGRALTERPDLFAAAVPQVGSLNTLRSETSANGPPNIPEFGTVTDPVGFKALLEMDSVSHVKKGVAYPAVLLTTGINDPRVDPWEPMKMAAALEAASSSGKPVLLRIDYAGGHGIGSTNSQREMESADVMSFMLWQSGVAGFQPDPN